MSAMLQPPVDPRDPGQAADEIDGLLHDFFKAELPRLWPPFQARPRRLASSSSWKMRMRSSLALAASVAILALSLGLLSGKIVDRPRSVSPGGSPTAGNSTEDGPRHGPIRPEKR